MDNDNYKEFDADEKRFGVIEKREFISIKRNLLKYEKDIAGLFNNSIELLGFCQLPIDVFSIDENPHSNWFYFGRKREGWDDFFIFNLDSSFLPKIYSTIVVFLLQKIIAKDNDFNLRNVFEEFMISLKFLLGNNWVAIKPSFISVNKNEKSLSFASIKYNLFIINGNNTEIIKGDQIGPFYTTLKLQDYFTKAVPNLSAQLAVAKASRLLGIASRYVVLKRPTA